MRFKVNMAFLSKGAIFAALILVGPLLGVIMRLSESNTYAILGVVASVNTLAFIAVYYLISKDFQPDEEKTEEKGKEKGKAE